MTSLTCAEVCMLVGQELGMEWLAAPVATFLITSPHAQFRFYPGDLANAALKAHSQMLKYAQTETKLWLAQDFGWMAESYAFAGDVLAEAQGALREAQRLARPN